MMDMRMLFMIWLAFDSRRPELAYSSLLPPPPPLLLLSFFGSSALLDNRPFRDKGRFVCDGRSDGWSDGRTEALRDECIRLCNS